MAINIEQLHKDVVEIKFATASPQYIVGSAFVLIQVVSPTIIQVTLNKGEITLPYAEIGTINGDTKPNTIQLTAKLLATDVFNTITTP